MSNESRLTPHVLSKYFYDEYEKSLHTNLLDTMSVDEDGEGFLCIIARSITVPLGVCFSNISTDLQSRLFLGDPSRRRL